MKTINKIKTIAASVLLSVSFSSCSDWLEVKMEDKIMEPVLFSDYQGYLAALNGVYLSMNDLYCPYLTFSTLDVMAQYYDVTDALNHTQKIYMNFKYSDGGFESTNGTLWSKTYVILANNNAILEHLKDETETPLTPKQFAIIKGEALALRALLHFDVVRRHGSVYSLNPDAEAIPYQENSKREIQPILTHKQVMDKVFADLNEASALLKQYDPILTEGVKNIVTEDNGVSNYDMCFRQLRLNYYAVQGLLARAYLWVGDKTNAYRVAKEIIDNANTDKLQVFPWVTKDQYEADKKPDRIFSSEIMFALYHSKRDNQASALFGKSTGLANRLTFYGTNFGDSKVAKFYDNDNDYRRLCWMQVEPTDAEIKRAEEAGEEPKSSLYLTKFDDFETGFNSTEVNTYRYMVPLLRMSEIYLIAAECTTDNDEAYKYINDIRFHRQAPDLPSEGVRQDDITMEFAREMLGEGQLFFYYKRLNSPLIMGRTGDLDKEMTAGTYVWPLPEIEVNKRTQVGNK